ncbi:MAG: hypothetical protein VB018_07700 [Lachnospiraceae bacterium]|nr:hypothetical protein [Lachnospiraceae bacterium]
MIILIFLELLLIGIPAILNYKLKNSLSSGWQYLFNVGFLMILLVVRPFVINGADCFIFIKFSLLIGSAHFYATDYIKYLKDKNNIELAKKTARNAALNHFAYIILLAVVFYFENYYSL